MADIAPTYDLMLLLDPKADDATRAKIREGRARHDQRDGHLGETQEYGRRPLAFEIGHDKGADYDLLQFQGPRELLEQLQRTLKITDGVLRFRIIKLRAGRPPHPTCASPPGRRAAGRLGRAGRRARRRSVALPPPQVRGVRPSHREATARIAWKRMPEPRIA